MCACGSVAHVALSKGARVLTTSSARVGTAACAQRSRRRTESARHLERERAAVLDQLDARVVARRLPARQNLECRHSLEHTRLAPACGAHDDTVIQSSAAALPSVADRCHGTRSAAARGAPRGGAAASMGRNAEPPGRPQPAAAAQPRTTTAARAHHLSHADRRGVRRPSALPRSQPHRRRARGTPLCKETKAAGLRRS